MSGAKQVNSKVFSALFFNRFGLPQKVEVQPRYKQGVVERVTFSFSHKETCGNNMCLHDGLWVSGKKVSFPVDLLGGIIGGLQGIQPSPLFDGKYRINQVVAELFYSDSDKSKRLEVIADYGQRCVKGVWLSLSSRNRCEERSCDVGKWVGALEVFIAAEVLPELISTLIEIKQEATGG